MNDLTYAVFPGDILSAHDTDVHFVSARRLIELYGVDPSECVVIHDEERVGRSGINLDELIHLRPSVGAYQIPEEAGY